MITGTDITDADREDEISREYQAMLDCYQAGNCQQADWHRQKMEALIRGRSANQVAAMEIERGLR